MAQDMLSDEQKAVLERSNPGTQTLARIYSAIDAEKQRGRTMEESWQEATRVLAGKPMGYHGNPDLDDTADAPYSLYFPKGAPELDSVLAGIAYQQLTHAAQPQAVKLALREEGYYGMTVKSVGTHWDDPTHSQDELQMSPSSARFLQHLLPEGGKMNLEAEERSAGHIAHSSHSR